MKNKLFTVLFVALAVCGVPAGAGAEETAPPVEEANPNPNKVDINVACLNPDQVTGQMTFKEMLPHIGACIQQEKFGDASYLFSLMMTYKSFDQQRVMDDTFPMRANNFIVYTFMEVEQVKADAYRKKYYDDLKGNHRIKLCKWLIKVGPPQYTPDFAQNPDTKDPVKLVENFNVEAGWLKALSEGASCPIKGLQLPYKL